MRNAPRGVELRRSSHAAHGLRALLLSALLLSMLGGGASAQVGKLYPADESARDPSFAAVLQKQLFGCYTAHMLSQIELVVLLMKTNFSPFKWRHYAPDVILLCVRWYCRFQLSYRDVEEMMRERGLDVDHSTVFDNNAAYPEAFSASQEERIVPEVCRLRRVKYLNNVIEQDHRFIKKQVRAS